MLGGWKGAARLWRPMLPILAMVAIPTGLVTLAIFNGPFVVAMVLFSPFASLLLVTGLSLLLAFAAACRHVLAHSLETLRRVGECPTCGYPLAASDARFSAVTCPECGHAWRIGEPPPPERIVVRIP